MGGPDEQSRLTWGDESQGHPDLDLRQTLLEQILDGVMVREEGPAGRKQAAVVGNVEDEERASLDHLLRIYADLREEAQREEQALHEKLDEMEAAYMELGQRRSQLFNQDQEIEILQEKVVQLNISLLDGKWESLNLQGDIERLRIERLQDRRKIDTLVSLTDDHRPASHKGPLIRDCRPRRTFSPERAYTQTKVSHKLGWTGSCIHEWTRSSKHKCQACIDLNKAKTNQRGSTNTRRRPATAPAATAVTHRGGGGALVTATTCFGSSHGSGVHLGRPQPTRRQVLRTVYLPNERADALLRSAAQVHDRFEEFKLTSSELIQMLAEDLRSKDAEYASEVREGEATIQQLMQTLATCEEDLIHKTKDYVELYSMMDVNETVREENKLKHAQDMTIIMAQKERIEQELKEFSLINTDRKDFYQQNLSSLVHESESSLSLLKEQHRALEVQYKTRIEKLEGRIAATQKHRKEVVRRGRLDMEGLCRDVLGLSRAVDGVHKSLGQQQAQTLKEYVRRHGGNFRKGAKKVDLAACVAKQEMCSPMELHSEIERLTKQVSVLRGYVADQLGFSH